MASQNSVAVHQVNEDPRSEMGYGPENGAPGTLKKLFIPTRQTGLPAIDWAMATRSWEGRARERILETACTLFQDTLRRLFKDPTRELRDAAPAPSCPLLSATSLMTLPFPDNAFK